MAVSCLQVSEVQQGCVSVLVPVGRQGWVPCPHPALTLPFPACSKTALLEGLEVDQYMLGILIYIQK